MNTQLLHLTTAVRALLLLAALFLALPDLPAQNARPPEKMSYQGYLVDANQLPLGNSSPVNHTVEFRIYSVSSGGTALWGESQTVTVDKGYFSVMLGDGTPIGTPATFSSIFTNATASDRFIGVKVASLSGSTEILPRLRLVPSPYAFLAASAVAVTGTNSIQSYSLSTNIGLWTKTRTNVIYSGGNVGIGSTNPGVPLTFSDTLGDKISLWGQSGNTFGFGIQAGLLQIHGGQSVDDIAFGYGSSAAMTERMRIKGNGNVGIGVVSPTVKLEVAGTVKATAFQGDGSTLTGLAGGLGAGSVDSTKILDGTIVNADLGAGSVDSTKILDGTIVNADISASAAIADTKLGTIASAGKVADSALSGNVALRNAPNNFSGDQFSTTAIGARPATASHGYIDMRSGDASNTGVLEFFRPGPTRIGYMGHSVVAGINNLGLKLESGANFNVNNGYVGIGTGTTAPLAPLEVKGYAYTLPGGNRYFNGSSFTSLSGNLPEAYVSIRAEWYLQGFGFIAVSDQRIKDIANRSETRSDLDTIQKLQVTDYRMKDRVAAGDTLHKGFIAQEVQKVIPEAVQKGRGFVPDIYAIADGLQFDAAAQSLRVSMAKAHGLKKGDLVRLIQDDATVEQKVSEVLDEKTFVVGGISSEPKRVFVFGKQVDDFLSVDYDRIFTTGISAIQELARKLAAQEVELSELRAELATLRSEKKSIAATVSALQARDEAREARLVRLEQALDKPAGTAKVQPTTRESSRLDH